MTLSTVLFALGLAAAVILVLSYRLMMAALDRRGYKTNVLLSRLYFFRDLGAYREATVKETGRTGPLIRVCISSVVLAFLFVVAGFLAPRG
jgi:aspartokinase